MLKIISGGQTGVDRGALDAALELGVECGGWCPAGRLAEDGRIPERYPVCEIQSAEYAARTRHNVVEGDATLIICKGELIGGTRETVEFCRELAKPHLVIDCERLDMKAAIESAAEFVATASSRAQRSEVEGFRDVTLMLAHRDPSASLWMTVLNVAGPRASQWTEGHEVSRQIIAAVLRRVLDRSGSSR